MIVMSRGRMLCLDRPPTLFCISLTFNNRLLIKIGTCSSPLDTRISTDVPAGPSILDAMLYTLLYLSHLSASSGITAAPPTSQIPRRSLRVHLLPSGMARRDLQDDQDTRQRIHPPSCSPCSLGQNIAVNVGRSDFGSMLIIAPIPALASWNPVSSQVFDSWCSF